MIARKRFDYLVLYFIILYCTIAETVLYQAYQIIYDGYIIYGNSAAATCCMIVSEVSLELQQKARSKLPYEELSAAAVEKLNVAKASDPGTTKPFWL